MSFGNKMKQVFEMLVFEEQAISKFSKDKANTKFAYLVLLIMGLAYGFGLGIFTGPLVIIFMLIGVITAIIGIWIIVLIYHLLALIFGGKGKLIEYFRAYASLNEIQWILVIPLLGLFLSAVASLWIFIVNIALLKNIHKLSTAKAVIVGILPVIIIIVLLVAGIVSLIGPLTLENMAGQAFIK